MSVITPIKADAAETRRPVDIARELGPVFGRRADEAKDEDVFVADNFAMLKDLSKRVSPASLYRRRFANFGLIND